MNLIHKSSLIFQKYKYIFIIIIIILFIFFIFEVPVLKFPGISNTQQEIYFKNFLNLKYKVITLISSNII